MSGYDSVNRNVFSRLSRERKADRADADDADYDDAERMRPQTAKQLN